MGVVERYTAFLNDFVSHSAVGRYFHLEGSGHVREACPCHKHLLHSNPQQPNEIRGARFATELRAGLTTFFTMAYIIAVNVSSPSIRSLDCH